ncbi:unnamed protein product [Cylindrotheca closterium]|uniref:C-CAP/cofactor C-like domain-containing protein n=1 Tax=Cylindrotheca closterium TaxID=2856 RepID=A0AAD2CK10_9STRA|nr:unnamed protein product [Cylindrotheca closterium]
MNCTVVELPDGKKSNPNDSTVNSEMEFLASQQARLKTIERSQRSQHADVIHSFWERLRTNLTQWEAKLQGLHKEASSENDNTTNVDGSKEAENTMTGKPQNVNQQLLDLKLELQQLQKHCLGSIVVFQDWEVPVLPVADLRLLHNVFTKHLAQWENSKQEIAPTGKFVFRRYREEVARRNAAHQTVFQSVSGSDAGTNRSKPGSGQTANEGASLQDLSDVSVVIDIDGSVRVGDKILSLQISDAALLVKNLKNCSLTILIKLMTLHIVDSEETEIVVQEQVGSAIHVTGCHSCQLQASGQQLRLHYSVALQCTVNIGAGAILEDCSRIVFVTNLNNMLDVRDFNWLRSGEPSPNYEIQLKALAVKEEAPTTISISTEQGKKSTDDTTERPPPDATMTKSSIEQNAITTATIIPTEEDKDDDDDDDDEL